MLTLDESSLHRLKDSKNLLAFSAGIDSSALFFLLLQKKIKFDIALVNYATRKESEEEEAYAQILAQKYQLNIYTTQAPSFENNFEKNAREFRYAFFDRLMENNEYDNLLTAHQLNDQLEWLLMRLCKGAGASELVGLESLSTRKSYTLVRPILHHSKDELLKYLHQHKHHYFVDESNNDEKYERNYFRKHFSNKLIKKYKYGIEKSFNYLQEDKKHLNSEYELVYKQKKLSILKLKNHYILARAVDRELKKLGYILSSKQREELKHENSIVFGGSWVVFVDRDYVFISPYLKNTMPKKFKEACRTLKIPSKIRPYLYEEKIEIKAFSKLI